MISHQQAATSTLSYTQTTPLSIAILTRQTKIILLDSPKKKNAELAKIDEWLKIN